MELPVSCSGVTPSGSPKESVCVQVSRERESQQQPLLPALLCRYPRVLGARGEPHRGTEMLPAGRQCSHLCSFLSLTEICWRSCRTCPSCAAWSRPSSWWMQPTSAHATGESRGWARLLPYAAASPAFPSRSGRAGKGMRSARSLVGCNPAFCLPSPCFYTTSPVCWVTKSCNCPPPRVLFLPAQHYLALFHPSGMLRGGVEPVQADFWWLPPMERGGSSPGLFQLPAGA